MLTVRMDAIVGIIVWMMMMMLLTANEVNSHIACYNCDSTTNEDCSSEPEIIRDKQVLQVDCPNADDECGLAFTIHPDTGHRRILNRTCWTRDQLRDYERRYGPELVGRLRVPSVERKGLVELVELRLSHCNRSLCNSRYPPEGSSADDEGPPTTMLECYFCSSVDNPSCDFDGIELKQMNDTVLARCPSVGGPFHCAMTYKTIRNDSDDDSQPRKRKRKVFVSRTCLSGDDLSSYERHLGSDLVGVDREDSALDIHLLVCDGVSGCNWRFADDDGQSDGPEEETTAVISCYVCNDETSSSCSLSANNITEMDDESLFVRPCPVDQSYGCVLWYKVQQLEIPQEITAAVVRSCLSRDDANRYRTTYATLNPNSNTTTTTTTSAIYSKEDVAHRSTYFLTMCFQSRCNLRFPDFEPEARVCFVCSQDVDDLCDAEGNGLSSTHLGRCPDPSDLCSLSYVVRRLGASGQPLPPSNVLRSCLSRSRAAEYQRHYSREGGGGGGDVFVIPGNASDESISDTHVYLCWSSNCNRRLPDKLKEDSAEAAAAPAPSALRCFTCSQHLPGDGPCGAQLTAEAAAATGALISGCAGKEVEKGEEQRCFMSYVLAADGRQSHFNRSCVSVSEILSLKRRYGPELIATDVGPQLHRYMFHCRGSLCNRHFPSEEAEAPIQSTIDCFICGGAHETRDTASASSLSSSSSSSSSSSLSDCGVDGSLLSVSLLRSCSVFDRFFCAVVAKYNLSSSPEALQPISMRRHCISQRDAAAYRRAAARLEVNGEGGEVFVYEERERTNGSSSFFKSFLFICRTNGCNADFPQLKSFVKAEMASGPVVNEARKKMDDEDDDEEEDEEYEDEDDWQQPRQGASRSMAQRPISAIGSGPLAMAAVAAVIVIVASSAVFGR